MLLGVWVIEVVCEYDWCCCVVDWIDCGECIYGVVLFVFFFEVYGGCGGCWCIVLEYD